MSFSVVPSASAASIAGTDRAASAANHVTSGAEKTAVSNRTETVDSIDKGNRSEDSGADGRQTLDTFERKHENPASENEDDTEPPKHSQPLILDPLAKIGAKIDLSA